jgi:hypothetical protein
MLSSHPLRHLSLVIRLTNCSTFALVTSTSAPPSTRSTATGTATITAPPPPEPLSELEALRCSMGLPTGALAVSEELEPELEPVAGASGFLTHSLLVD